MKMPKIAVLYYGQPRIHEGYNYPLAYLKEYYKRHDSSYEFDVYMHMWSSGNGQYAVRRSGCLLPRISGDLRTFLQNEYKPISLLIEEQKTFNPVDWLHPITLRHSAAAAPKSIALSQTYSITKVCESVTNPEEYTQFILVRTDSVIDCWLLPLLGEINKEAVYAVHDFIMIFSHKVLVHIFKQVI